MKKLAAILSAALVLSLAAPAFAAVEFGGKLGTELELHRDANDEWAVRGRTGIELQTEVKAEGSGPLRAVVELKPWEFDNENIGFDDDEDADHELEGGFPIDWSSRDTPVEIGIEKAWIESVGSFWNGGPAVTTRLGDVEVEWDTYVGHLEDAAGITVEGMEIGPVTGKAFYLWKRDQANVEQNPLGIAAEGHVEGVDLKGMLVRQNSENNISLSAAMDIMPGMNVSGQFALDADNNRLYRLDAKADSLIQGVTLTAGYRGADDTFAPFYTNRYDEDGEEVYDLLTGFSIGAETVQSGIRLAADYDDPTKETNLSAETEIEGFKVAASTKLVDSEVEETELEVSRHFIVGAYDILGEYSALIVPGDDVEHTLKASTKTNMIPQLMGLGLSGEVVVQGGDITYKAGADYKAPNGLNLAAEYHSEDGPSITGGVTVEF